MRPCDVCGDSFELGNGTCPYCGDGETNEDIGSERCSINEWCKSCFEELPKFIQELMTWHDDLVFVKKCKNCPDYYGR